MPQGFQAWDAAGNLIFDTADRLTRILGQTTVNGTAGNVVDARFATGTPWSVLVSDDVDYERQGITVTFAGTTMSWTTGNFSGVLLYGVY